MEIKVKVNEEDMAKLEKLHYLVESKASLINRYLGDSSNYKEEIFNKLTDSHAETFKEYSIYKEEIDNKYRPEQYKDTAKYWTANFITKELVYEVE